MTNRQIDNRVAKIQDMEAQVKVLEKQIEELKDALKAEMETNGEEEHDTGSFIIRWKVVVSNRLDSKTLKAELPDVYSKYSKESSSKRFTINATS